MEYEVSTPAPAHMSQRDLAHQRILRDAHGLSEFRHHRVDQARTHAAAQIGCRGSRPAAHEIDGVGKERAGAAGGLFFSVAEIGGVGGP